MCRGSTDRKSDSFDVDVHTVLHGSARKKNITI